MDRKKQKEYATLAVFPETFVRFRALKGFKETADELINRLIDNYEKHDSKEIKKNDFWEFGGLTDH